MLRQSHSLARSVTTTASRPRVRLSRTTRTPWLWPMPSGQNWMAREQSLIGGGKSIAGVDPATKERRSMPALAHRWTLGQASAGVTTRKYRTA